MDASFLARDVNAGFSVSALLYSWPPLLSLSLFRPFLPPLSSICALSLSLSLSPSLCPRPCRRLFHRHRLAIVCNWGDARLLTPYALTFSWFVLDGKPASRTDPLSVLHTLTLDSSSAGSSEGKSGRFRAYQNLNFPWYEEVWRWTTLSCITSAWHCYPLIGIGKTGSDCSTSAWALQCSEEQQCGPKTLSLENRRPKQDSNPHTLLMLPTALRSALNFLQWT